jgi:hypothetical protein
MAEQAITLIDSTGSVIASARVADAGPQYEGTIDLSATPPPIRSLFAEFEDVVNGQEFALLDGVHARVDALGLRARFADREVAVENLQVFPETGGLSFRVRDYARTTSRPAFTHSAASNEPRPVVS